MRKVAIIADSHFDEHSRFEECVRIHDFIAEECKRRGVDAVLHSGDVYERKSTPKERAAVAHWVQKITQCGPMVIVRGNHDALGDLPLLERLETDHAVTVVEGAQVVYIHNRETGASFAVACLGWPNKANILALGADSHAEGELLASDALRNVIRGLGHDMRRSDEAIASDSMPRILLAHAMVRGSKVSTGQPLVGCDLEVGLEDLRLCGADLYALGHIHMPQCWDQSGELDLGGFFHDRGNLPDVVYPGSPRRTSYGELEDKHFVIATFDDEGKLADVEYVKTPCAPMVHLEGVINVDGVLDLDAASDKLLGDVSVQGADVRLRYYVAPDLRDRGRVEAASLKDDLIADGACAVKVDEVVETTTRARAPELATAATLADRLDAYWKAKDSTPDGPRRRKLFEKLALLEGGVG